MARVKAGLILALLLALTIKVMWWTLAPAVPYLVIALLLVGIYTYIFRRKW